MKRLLLTGAFLVLWQDLIAAETLKLQLTVSAGKTDRTNVPVRVPLSLPKTFVRTTTAELRLDDTKSLPGQFTDPGIVTSRIKPSEKDLVRRDLHFILPGLKAGTSCTLDLEVAAGTKSRTDSDFNWSNLPADAVELRKGNRPVLRYMYKPLDESTRKKREQTYKVFHHLLDPDGKRLVTKGPGGLYTHHRGLFYCFRIIHYGGHKKPVDIWHCTNDTYQSHDRILATEAGPALGRHRVAIAWHGHKKEVFAREERELTVYAVPGGTLVEFASRLASPNGNIKLDGDPQHAGFHFRAAQDVAAKTSKQTYFLRPDGRDKPGATRNWPENKKHVNLPWDAMSFILDGQRYTAAYLDKPTNPKEARYSERDYGRFGSYFVAEVTKDKPLVVNYRIWLQKGEMSVPQAAGLSADFVTPVDVKVK
jgi:hypothetical protein